MVDGINGPDRENRTFLAGHQCPAGLLASQDMAQVVGFAQLVLMVIPTQFVVPTMAQVGQLFRPDHILCSCAKGIENDTLETCDQILDRVLPPHMRNRTSFLSGPSFAAEVRSPFAHPGQAGLAYPAFVSPTPRGPDLTPLCPSLALPRWLRASPRS